MFVYILGVRPRLTRSFVRKSMISTICGIFLNALFFLKSPVIYVHIYFSTFLSLILKSSPLSFYPTRLHKYTHTSIKPAAKNGVHVYSAIKPTITFLSNKQKVLFIASLWQLFSVIVDCLYR